MKSIDITRKLDTIAENMKDLQIKGTTLYHKTKDILHVKEKLGHKNVQNTLIYIHLEAAIFNTVNDEFTIRTAGTVEKAKQLLEVGFEYVTEMEGVKLFRKRK